ncbi:hypothetical protein ACX1C1_11910 [Paenibacillus sp. strain BS8-2]
MIKRNRLMTLISASVMISIFVSGCGAKQSNEETGSFGEAVVADRAESESTTVGGSNSNNLTGTEGSEAGEGTPVPIDGEPEGQSAEKSVKPSPEAPGHDTLVDDAAGDGAIEVDLADPAAPSQQSDKLSLAASPSPIADNKVNETSGEKAPSGKTGGIEVVPTPASPVTEQTKGDSNDAQKAKTPSITWSGFFDNEDQTTPSDQFWDLSEARTTVRIKGFMGEVLSIGSNWFLLIPEPGAECPFDNGDETYWNKIMIVFVKDGTKLRYTSKPLELTGRLDVGIKIDESGYKTMFRLYDATFKEVKG